MELAAAASLAFAVHQDLLVVEQITSLATGIDHVRQLEELTQPDRVAADWDLALIHRR
jgi:hypothetical protein